MAKKVCCQRCGRTPADEKRDPGPCAYGFKRHLWGEWTGKAYYVPSRRKRKSKAPEAA